jgi:hypothetical protein
MMESPVSLPPTIARSQPAPKPAPSTRVNAGFRELTAERAKHSADTADRWSTDIAALETRRRALT